MYQTKSSENARNIGMAYCLESSGSLLGGVLLSFILIRFLNSVTISVILGLLNILSAAYLQLKTRRDKSGIMFAAAFLAIVIAVVVLWFFSAWDDLDDYSRSRQWQGYQILEARNSIYGNIMVTKRDGQ